MRLIKLKERDNFLIGYGALLITGEVFRFGRDGNNSVHSRLTFEGISLLFPSSDSYTAKTPSVLMCFTQPELNLTAKNTEAIARASEENSLINLDSRQNHILEDIVSEQEVIF